MPERIWRVDMVFKRHKEAPPAHTFTYIKAPTAAKAEEIARKNHGKEYGGIKGILVKVVKEKGIGDAS